MEAYTERMNDMNETITIDKTEYNRLVDLSEHALDAVAIHAFKTKLVAGEEELIPAVFANRMIDGESPLQVYRDYRGLTQTALAKSSGVNRVQIADIEAGRNKGSVTTLQKLSTALGVMIDDLV